MNKRGRIPSRRRSPQSHFDWSACWSVGYKRRTPIRLGGGGGGGELVWPSDKALGW